MTPKFSAKNLKQLGALLLLSIFATFPASVSNVQATSKRAIPNSTLKTFVPPDNINDFPPEKSEEEAEFRSLWSKNINQWTEQAILGDPWTVLNDRDRQFYYNPLHTAVPVDSKEQLVSWFPFPNRFKAYFSDRFSSEEFYELADNGELSDGRKIPNIPSKVCPQIDPASKPKPYFPEGPRGWQDEYCEWSVKRDPKTHKILSVMFTSENPDYWRALWNIDPELVTDLYRKILHNPLVQKEDLYLMMDGKVVIDPVIGRPAYDISNKWNRGTETLADRGGAVHLTSPPNTLRAEIYLGGAATLLRNNDHNPQELMCASQFGQNFRNSDPHIGFAANQLVKNLNEKISLSDPVGLYILDPDFSRFSLPANAPAKAKVSDFWKVVRGTAGGYTLHAVFEVPPEYGFTVSDILIDKKPIRWASQITETFKIGLRVTPIISNQAVQSAQPDIIDSPHPLAQPILLSGFDILRASHTVDRCTPWFAPSVKRGQTIHGLGLAARSTDKKASFQFTGDGLTVQIKGTKKIKSPSDGVITLFNFDLAVSKTATLGKRDILLKNPGQEIAPLGQGFLEVVD